VNIAQEVTVLVTVVVVVSLDVDFGTGGGKMYETLTHPDVVVEVVVKGYTASVATVCQTVGSEGFTVTVLLTQDVTVAAVVTARRPTSTPGAAFPAANATPANQGSNEKNGLNSMSNMEPAEGLVEYRCKCVLSRDQFDKISWDKWVFVYLCQPGGGRTLIATVYAGQYKSV
jgi:hypothetical protein